MPSSPVNLEKMEITRNIQLADDKFYLPREVEIGADLYPYLIRPGRVTCGCNHPVLQESSLG
jgi:hypothetical protein